MTEYRRQDGHESIDAARGVEDVWVVVARARASGSRRALAAAQGVVFRRFLPMARALAAAAVPAGGPVDPGAAERAAENGLAKAVGWWRSADGAGFALFARITIAAELDRMSASRGEDSVTGVGARFAAVMRDQPPQGVAPEWLPARLARAAVQVLPGVAGAGISVLAGPGRRIPVGASDDVAATAERLQFTMGQGPCLPADTRGGAVIATGAMIAARWPLLYQELTARTPYRAVLSLPLRYRPTGVGALDLHLLQDDGEAALGALPDVAAVADQIVTALAESHASARRPGRAGSAGRAWLDSPSAQRRRRVWAVVGRLGVQLDLPVPDALDTLRAAAFARGRFVDDLAEDLTTGRLPLADLAD